ncbi:MAG: 16S rRNA processing protein RimM [Bradyrhizobiaceae bacterium]|nr:16S rRNA processing protein RimM [Bradyrhizobiaceae bacterium]
MNAAQRVRVGRIGAAHGIRGEVRLFVDADDPLDVKKLGALEDEAGARCFRIVALRQGKGHLIARLEGVDDRTAAERLTNLELYVPRDRLPQQKDKDTFYQADLVGLRVESADGERLGTLLAVQNFGAGDILEISPPGGGESFMIPFRDPFVPAVDIEGGKVVLELPADFFEPVQRSRDET